MRRSSRAALLSAAAVLAAAMGAAFGKSAIAAGGEGTTPRPGGFVVEREAQVERHEPGPHHGLGRTTGYVFFQRVPGVPFSFRKRVLHPGSSIGEHPQTEDEVYYVVNGTGVMTIDGKKIELGPGDAVLTRTGSSHALLQTGERDLTLVIVFPIPAARPAAPPTRP